jgi:phosphoribosylanthranilate isomerase
VPRPLFVKVCGVMSVEAARSAALAGVDAIGFRFFERSLRRVSPEQATIISQALPRPRPLRVGVFVNASPATIAAIDAAVGLDVIQLGGDEDPEYVARIGPKAMKVLRLTDRSSLASLPRFRVQAFLLQRAASVREEDGFDWTLARAARGPARILVGGGLTVDNVAAVVTAACPYGVDVSTGVESAPGTKDPDRIRRFVATARAAAAAPPAAGGHVPSGSDKAADRCDGGADHTPARR